MSVNIYDSSTQTLTKVPGTETSAFTGATSSAAGTKGLVPAPASGAQNKVLGGDGTWKTVQTSGVSGSTDPVSSGALYKCECLKISTGSTVVTSLPYTFSNSLIESDMVCINSELGTPSSQTSDWTVDTANGTATISGSISSTGTTITLYLIKSR